MSPPAQESAGAPGPEEPPGDPAGPASGRSQLRALVELATIVTTVRRPDDMVEAVAEIARDLLHAASLSLSRFEPEHGWIRTLVNVGDLGPGEERRPADEVYPVEDFPETLTFLRGGQVRRRATVLDDPDAEPAEVELLRRLDKASSLKTCIVQAGRAWGEMWAARRSDQPLFTEEDGELAEVIVALVSAGLSQAEVLADLEQRASTDALTGVGNRWALDEALERLVPEDDAAGRPTALVIADVNGLKEINDSLGHPYGDALLRHVGAVLRALAAEEPGRVAARLGGDEFCLLLSGTSADEARHVAERLRDGARDGHRSARLSLGVAVALPGAGVGTARLLGAADEAQYTAKRAGSPSPVVVEVGDRRLRGATGV